MFLFISAELTNASVRVSETRRPNKWPVETKTSAWRLVTTQMFCQRELETNEDSSVRASFNELCSDGGSTQITAVKVLTLHSTTTVYIVGCLIGHEWLKKKSSCWPPPAAPPPSCQWMKEVKRLFIHPGKVIIHRTWTKSWQTELHSPWTQTIYFHQHILQTELWLSKGSSKVLRHEVIILDSSAEERRVWKPSRTLKISRVSSLGFSLSSLRETASVLHLSCIKHTDLSGCCQEAPSRSHSERSAEEPSSLHPASVWPLLALFQWCHGETDKKSAAAR